MLPSMTDYRWKSLITGKINHNFKSIPAGLMISRLTRWAKQDNSQDEIKKYIQEAYSFFTKFEKILDDDIKSIFR